MDTHHFSLCSFSPKEPATLCENTAWRDRHGEDQVWEDYVVHSLRQVNIWITQNKHLDSWRPKRGKRFKTEKQFIEHLINVISTSAISLDTEFHHLHIQNFLPCAYFQEFFLYFSIIYYIFIVQNYREYSSANLFDLIY